MPEKEIIIEIAIERLRDFPGSPFSVAMDEPMQDLIEARTEYAKSLLLQQSDLPLSAVAEKLGYHDQFHFIRQFRQKVGMTPGQFRKENQ